MSEKLSAFEYENKVSRESNNNTERSNWSSFKEAPYKNPKPVDNFEMETFTCYLARHPQFLALTGLSLVH